MRESGSLARGFDASSGSANAMPAPPRTEISKDVAAMTGRVMWLLLQDHPCRIKIPPATSGVVALRVVQRRTPRTRRAMYQTKFAILIPFCRGLIRQSGGVAGIAKHEREEVRTNKTLDQTRFLRRRRCPRSAKKTVNAADRTPKCVEMPNLLH